MYSPPKAHRSGVKDYHNCLDIDYFHLSSTNPDVSIDRKEIIEVSTSESAMLCHTLK